MAVDDVVVTLLPEGVAELLRTDPVLKADLNRRMNRVLRAAQVDNPEASLELVDQITDRERIRVVDTGPGAIEREAHTGRLLRALDQAGGA